MDSKRLSPDKSRLGGLIVLLGVCLLGGLGLIGYQMWSGYRGEIRAAETMSVDFATIIEARLEATLRRVDSLLEEHTIEVPVAALSKQAVPLHAGEIDARLDVHRRNFPELRALRIFDAEGDMLYSTDRATTPPLNVSDRDFMKELRDDPRGRTVFSQVMVGRLSGKETLFAVRAFRDATGAFRGTVGAAIDLDHFLTLFRSVDVGSKGLVAVLRRDRFMLVARWPEGSHEVNETLSPDSSLRRALSSDNMGGTFRGGTRLYGFRSVEAYPFLVLVGLAHDEVLADWRGRSLTVGHSTLVLLVLLGILLRLLWRAEAIQKKATADLLNSRRYFQDLVEFAPDAILLADANGAISLVNRQAEEMFGFERGDLVGRPVETLMPDSARSKHVGLREHFMAAGTPRTMGLGLSALMGQRKDGTVFPVDISIAPFGPPEDKMVAVIVRDITVRKAIERDLAGTRGLLIDMVESVGSAIGLYDWEGRLVLFNRLLAEQVPAVGDLVEVGAGVEALFRAAIERGALVVPPGRDVEDVVAERLDAHRKCDGVPIVQRLSDGRILHVTSRRSLNGGVIVISADVTEQVKAEERLLAGQRLEAIGKLTGGMAHDFNNYLGVIIGNLDLLLDRSAADPVATEWIEAALRGAESSAQLTRSLLAFARQQPLAPRRIDVGRNLTEVATLLQRTLGEDIVLKVEVAPDLWPAKIDGAQFDSSIVNLANNARDAMPSGGPLTISARNVRVEDIGGRRPQDVAPGDYILIEVTDAGTGMTPDAVARAFEPFFTTKPVSHGTGLGLSMVYGFVKQSGGWVYIDSAVGRGTTVRLYLRRDGEAGTADASAPEAAPAAGGKETILVVEDNPTMRQTAVQQLTALGYGTIEAENGVEALAILTQGDRWVDLLFTDIVMPGNMNGYDLAQRALAARPGLKVLLTSGYPGETLNAPGLRDIALLAKPYRQPALARAIRATLDGTPWKPEGPA